MRRPRSLALLLLLALTIPADLIVPAAPAAADRPGTEALEAALDELVAMPDGPPGVIVLIQTGDLMTVHRAGLADIRRRRPMQWWQHMRIASTAKAYSGGVALALVDRGVLSLDDTMGDLLPWVPATWSDITLGEMLHHTSGLPDFSRDDDFLTYLRAHLTEPLPPRQLLSFVTDADMVFGPGTAYGYSNSDNIAVALMAKAATGLPYTTLLRRMVYRPGGLTETSLPRGVHVPLPTMHGYFVEGDEIEDQTELIAAGWSWASGGIVSTPLDQNRFIRAYVGRHLFGGPTQAVQFDWVPGTSEPPGPGANDAGLAVFRYRTACGTMFGHTGNTLGYTQFMAASRDGSRSVVVSVNRQTSPTEFPQVFAALRELERLAVCAALEDRPIPV